MVRVHQHQLVLIEAEGEGRLITRCALVGEVLEDLLERRLRDRVLLDAKVAFLFLELSEQPPYSFAFFRYAQLKVLATVLQKLDLGEVLGQVSYDLETVLHSLQELE